MQHSDRDLSAFQWRKSSHSGSESANCVEVALSVPGIVPVRDSKDPHGPALLFTPDAFSAFVGSVRSGDLPLRPTTAL